MKEEDQLEAREAALAAQDDDDARDWFDELQTAPPFLALEGKSGKPIYVKRGDVASVYFDRNGDVCVATDGGEVFALSEQSGNRMLSWAHRRAEAPE